MRVVALNVFPKSVGQGDLHQLLGISARLTKSGRAPEKSSLRVSCHGIPRLEHMER